MVRKTYIKLTGVMCVRTNDYYTEKWRSSRDAVLQGPRMNDEVQLTRLVNSVWTPLPIT